MNDPLDRTEAPEQLDRAAFDYVQEAARRLGAEVKAASSMPALSADGNVNWRVQLADDRHYVLRQYHRWATESDLAYEHAVLRHLQSRGWSVPLLLGIPFCMLAAGFALLNSWPGRAGGRVKRSRSNATVEKLWRVSNWR